MSVFLMLQLLNMQKVHQKCTEENWRYFYSGLEKVSHDTKIIEERAKGLLERAKKYKAGMDADKEKTIQEAAVLLKEMQNIIDANQMNQE